MMNPAYRTSLQTLDDNHNPPRHQQESLMDQGNNQPPRTASSTGRGSRASHNLPEEVCEVFQWKYEVTSPWWRRLYFRYVYLPFARFSFHVMRIVPFERLDPDGSLSWKHEQGVWFNREDAEREAAKYKFGGWRVVKLNLSEPEQAVYGRSHFPNSDEWQQYEQAATNQQVAAARRLQDVLAESHQVVEQFRSSSRV